MGFRYCCSIFLVLAVLPAAARKTSKKVVKQLKADIGYLAGEELQGRRTGTDGEKKAGDYIEKRYQALKIPAYKGQYKYPFNFTYGKEIAATSRITLNGKEIHFPEDGFPLPYSATRVVKSEVLPEVTEQGNIWLVQLYTDKDQANDPHFDVDKHMYEAARDAKRNGASGIIFYDGFGSKYEPTFNKHSDLEQLELPAAFINNGAWQKYMRLNDASQHGGVPVTMNITINRTERTGTNLAAYIDNGARYTVVIGAHYDHLGFGEDGNSLHANAVKEHQVHYGADDNASGTAALLNMAAWLKGSKLRHYNYMLVHFSGEELGLFGSKAFVKEQGLDSNKVAYMLNMDMVGRLNDSTHALTVGGVGTSPAWADVVAMGNEDFKIVIDSSGVGPSDHTSFYNAGIPVLFFFTGTHKDYHKPTDRPEFINYNGEVEVLNYARKVVTKMDKDGVKPAFRVTKQINSGKSKFKVTLGIMPDYTFQDGGVKVDGVTDNKSGAKAGIKIGDIIVKMGDIPINGMQTYMEALGKFMPGDTTTVIVKRNGSDLPLKVVFLK
jgi:hypothetical protein